MVSPDAFVQMTIQLAYFKMYGKNRPTYESASTRKFAEAGTSLLRVLGVLGEGSAEELDGLLAGGGVVFVSIYQDPAYAYSSSWYLSTSQLSSEFFNGYGWSQVSRRAGEASSDRTDDGRHRGRH
jgi:carnitine O-acetyltransferase